MPRPKRPVKAGKVTTPDDIEIGARIRAVRLDRKMTQDSLGKELGLTFQQVQKYEKGTNRVSTVRAKQIATIFGISLEELVGKTAPTIDGFSFDTESYKLAREFVRLPDHLKAKLRGLIRSIIDGD